MPNIAYIELGGLTIRLHSDCPLILTECRARDYRVFRRKAAAPRHGGDVINLRLDTGNMPSVSGMHALLEDGPAWSVYSEGGNHRMVVLKSDTMDAPLWQMLVDLGSNEVVVYCGTELMTRSNGRTKVLNPVAYPLDLILMMYALAKRSGMVVHAAGIGFNGRGLLFPGISGAGKSTLTRLFKGLPDAVRLSDDRIVVRDIGGEQRMFGTPWLGEAGVCANGSASFSAMLFLRKSRTNKLTKLDRRQAIERLLPVVSIPWYDRELISPILATCEATVDTVPAYDFGFTPTADAVKLLKTQAFEPVK